MEIASRETALSALSMADFTRYFEKKKLSRLYFPNGKCAEDCNSPFFIHLKDLYMLVVKWRRHGTFVPADDIIAIIAFGSAVRHPDTQEIVETSRRYWLFGQKQTTIRQIPIQPHDADFLVITVRNRTREEVLKPTSAKGCSSGKTLGLQRGGIHLINRGGNQVINGVRAGDTISVSALQEGVPVFFDDRLNNIVEQSGVVNTTPRRLSWDDSRECRCLVGTIF